VGAEVVPGVGVAACWGAGGGGGGGGGGAGAARPRCLAPVPHRNRSGHLLVLRGEIAGIGTPAAWLTESDGVSKGVGLVEENVDRLIL